ncbi:MAG TPA: hypothetical protein VMT15_01375 [Bryobacteraceae bacterium]|nr:hypothetical protein [Bryobacteraceae bacterium]
MSLLLILFLALDLAAIRQEPNPERRSERATDNAMAAMESAREASTAGNFEKMKMSLNELRESVDLAYESLEGSGKDARKSPKFFKRAELKTRELVRRLEGLAQSVDPDQRVLVESVRDSVSKVHDELIQDIMHKK